MAEVKISRGSHQCILLSNLFAFTDLYKDAGTAKTPQSFATVLGDSTMARTHLSSFEEAEPILGLNHGQLSSLIPMTKLYKQKAGGPFTEIKFDEYYDTSLYDMTESQNNRSIGSGIKSVDINMEGDAVATAERQYKVTIKFFFASVRELFTDRGTGKHTYRYEDLITPFRNAKANPTDACLEGTQQSKTVAARNAATMRYKLEFGYAEPSNTTLFTANQLEALQRARRGIFLNLYKHNVEFNENGTINITAEYHGYIEKSIANVDILRMGLGVTELMSLQYQERGICNRKEYDRRVQQEEQEENQPSDKKNSKCEDSGARKPRVKKGWYESYTDDFFNDDDDVEEREDKIADVRTKGYKSFMNGIINQGRMHRVVYVPHKDINFKDYKFQNGVITLGYSPRRLEKNKRALNYFFLGDLMENIFDFANKSANYSNSPVDVNFALGAVSVRDKTTNKTRSVPLASLPIALTHFRKWFKEYVIGKGERESYNLLDFIRDMFNNLVKSSFSPQCFKDRKTEVINGGYVVPKFEISTFTSTRKYRGNLHYTDLQKKHLNPINIEKGKTHVNYYIYGVNSHTEKSTETASPAEDRANGIYHLISGVDSGGLTKRINFSKDDMKYATEATMEKGNMGKHGILWGKYDADIELFGNPLFKPGMKVYVAPNNLSPSEVRSIGMGGYYYVTKVYNNIQGGKYTTELKCKFHNSPKRSRC